MPNRRSKTESIVDTFTNNKTQTRGDEPYIIQWRGHDHGFVVSVLQVRNPVPMKTHRVENKMHVQSVETKSPRSSVAVVWRLGEGESGQHRCHLRHLTMAQNCAVRHQ
ncbi:hypothetical protein TNCV_2652151 [Trichonephila clavipes]|nr:hypothetical protein TNCV_2652151 [Trichonephila clavipes]